MTLTASSSKLGFAEFIGGRILDLLHQSEDLVLELLSICTHDEVGVNAGGVDVLEHADERGLCGLVNDLVCVPSGHGEACAFEVLLYSKTHTRLVVLVLDGPGLPDAGATSVADVSGCNG